MNRVWETLHRIHPVTGAVLVALAIGACFRADVGGPPPEAAGPVAEIETAVFALG